MDGQLLDAEAEQKAKKYIEAAIERRCSEVRESRIAYIELQ